VLNHIWLALVVLAVAMGGWNNRLNEVTAGAFDGAQTAVTIALGLIGVMALWLGVMRLAERAGLVQRIAHGLRPIMRRLFPDVPPEHPAMGSMLMNMAANMLGPWQRRDAARIALCGSTETTFYVAAVYFGSVGVKQTRHAIPARLFGDLAGVIASVIICRAVL